MAQHPITPPGDPDDDLSHDELSADGIWIGSAPPTDLPSSEVVDLFPDAAVEPITLRRVVTIRNRSGKSIGPVSLSFVVEDGTGE